MVRRWIANPLSPVRIWVPLKISNLDLVFEAFSTYSESSDKSAKQCVGNVVELVDTTDLKSVA